MEAVYEPGITTAWNVYAMCKVEGGRWREIHDIVGAGAKFHSREIKRRGNEGSPPPKKKYTPANHGSFFHERHAETDVVSLFSVFTSFTELPATE